jgi:hypothetical protein
MDFHALKISETGMPGYGIILNDITTLGRFKAGGETDGTIPLLEQLKEQTKQPPLHRLDRAPYSERYIALILERMRQKDR